MTFFCFSQSDFFKNKNFHMKEKKTRCEAKLTTPLAQKNDIFVYKKRTDTAKNSERNLWSFCTCSLNGSTCMYKLEHTRKVGRKTNL